MNRREFVKLLCATGMSSAFATKLTIAAAATPVPYAGPLVIFINTRGGWDPNMFCDPKPNLRTWGSSGSTQTVGNLPYAPIDEAGNQFVDFFYNKYYQNTLIINGVNMETNAHVAGVPAAYTGTLASGYPTLSAAFTAVNGRDLPMGYLVTGQFRATGGLLPYTAINESSLLRDLSQPNFRDDAGVPADRVPTNVQAVIRDAQLARIERLGSVENVMPRRKLMNQFFSQAVAGSEAIESLGAILPGAFEDQDPFGNPNELIRQADIFLHAMAAGLTAGVDAELAPGGLHFDTHSDHDPVQTHALFDLVYGLDFIWERAAALGLDDRLTVVVSSDFGRTPNYNSSAGTDHWPINSFMVMETKPSSNIGDRIVGFTDTGFNAGKIDPLSLQPDPGSGIELKSAHVHKALRRYLGINDDPLLQPANFNEFEDVSIFTSAASTPQV